MVKVKGALTGKSMSVPHENIGLIMRCQRAEFIDDLYNDYPISFTRLYLKTSLDGIKYVDCIESVNEITTRRPEYSTKFFVSICVLLAAMLAFIIYG